MRSANLLRQYDTLRHDFAQAVRALTRAPAYLTVTVLVVALGVSLSTVVIGIYSALVTKALPFPSFDELVSVTYSHDRTGTSEGALSMPAVAALAASGQSLRDVSYYLSPEPVLGGTGNEARTMLGVRVSSTFFNTLGTRPLLGRWFDQSDAERAGVAIISYGLWLLDFGGDPQVVGAHVTLDGTPHVIVSVMPGEFAFPGRHISIWIPDRASPGAAFDHGTQTHHTIARVAARDHARASRVLEPIASRLQGDNARWAASYDWLPSSPLPALHLQGGPPVGPPLFCTDARIWYC